MMMMKMFPYLSKETEIFHIGLNFELKKISLLSTFKTLNSFVYLGCGKSVQTLNTEDGEMSKREKRGIIFTKSSSCVS